MNLCSLLPTALTLPGTVTLPHPHETRQGSLPEEGAAWDSRNEERRKQGRNVQELARGVGCCPERPVDQAPDSSTWSMAGALPG
ncbi:unnamed protein product, partial [Nesidiocoris tenuis]